MNLLQPSETLNYDDDRESTSMLHTGVGDTTLTKLTAGKMPLKNASNIDKLITDLHEKPCQRDAIVAQLINAVLNSFEPATRADYLWYLQFAVSVLLLKDLPVSLYALQGHLLTKCFSPPTTIWDSNPVKLDYFASHLYNLTENDKNLVFVTSQMENRSTFGFYVSLCMLWKSIYRCVGDDRSIFRLYPASDLIAVTKKISLKQLDTDFETVLNFIILHSKILSLIFHRKRRSPHYKCFEEFFVYDSSLVDTLKEFLESTLTKADAMWRRHNENLNYLTMIEYLQIDISELDTLSKNLHK